MSTPEQGRRGRGRKPALLKKWDIPELGADSNEYSLDEYVQAWHSIDHTLWNVNWVKGELASRIETHYGESELKEFAKRVEDNFNSIQEYRRVFKAYDQSSKRLDIPWSVHQALAAQDDRANLIIQAAKEDWTVKDAVKFIKARTEPASQPGTERGPAPAQQSGGTAPESGKKAQTTLSPEPARETKPGTFTITIHENMTDEEIANLGSLLMKHVGLDKLAKMFNHLGYTVVTVKPER